MTDETPGKRAGSPTDSSAPEPTRGTSSTSKSVSSSKPGVERGAKSKSAGARHADAPVKDDERSASSDKTEGGGKSTTASDSSENGLSETKTVEGVTKADTKGSAQKSANARPAESPQQSSNTAVIPKIDQNTPAGETASVDEKMVRQARLRLKKIDPWSIAKITFALTVALMIVAVVAVTILWIVLSVSGVWDQVNSSVTTVLSDDSDSFDITNYLGFGRMVGIALVLSAINVVVMTAVATIAAYLYNLAAELLGGVEVTLTED